MKQIALILSLALLAQPAAADLDVRIGVGVNIGAGAGGHGGGHGGGHPGTGRPDSGFSAIIRPDRARGPGKHPGGHPDKHPGKHPRPYRYHPYVVFERDPDPVYRPSVIEQAPRALPATVVPPPPPDPRGPETFSVTGPATDIAVGSPLPPGVPVVVLPDWRSYELDPPPQGQVYARRGRTLLLLTASDRVVVRILGDF